MLGDCFALFDILHQLTAVHSCLLHLPLNACLPACLPVCLSALPCLPGVWLLPPLQTAP